MRSAPAHHHRPSRRHAPKISGSLHGSRLVILRLKGLERDHGQDALTGQAADLRLEPIQVALRRARSLGPGPHRLWPGIVAAQEGQTVAVVLDQHSLASLVGVFSTAIRGPAALPVQIQRVQIRLRSVIQVMIAGQFDDVCPGQLQHLDVLRGTAKARPGGGGSLRTALLVERNLVTDVSQIRRAQPFAGIFQQKGRALLIDGLSRSSRESRHAGQDQCGHLGRVESRFRQNPSFQRLLGRQQPRPRGKRVILLDEISVEGQLAIHAQRFPARR